MAPDLFTGFRVEAFPHTSRPALALAAAAHRRSPSLGELVSLELRDLLFEHGQDVADPDVLSRLAARHDLTVTIADQAAVDLDHAEGVRRGVIGSPHFFTASGSFFCPSLQVSRRPSGELEVVADPEGFERFVASCAR